MERDTVDELMKLVRQMMSMMNILQQKLDDTNQAVEIVLRKLEKKN